jgi:hypothetical protein
MDNADGTAIGTLGYKSPRPNGPGLGDDLSALTPLR